MQRYTECGALQKQKTTALRAMCHQLNIPVRKTKKAMVQSIIKAKAITLDSDYKDMSLNSKIATADIKISHWIASRISIRIRAIPTIDRCAITNARIEKGEHFAVVEERHLDGILFLKLADNRGWVFETDHKQRVLCNRINPVSEQDAMTPLKNYSGVKTLEMTVDNLPTKLAAIKSHIVNDWNSSCVPRGIHLPWNIFEDDVKEYIDNTSNQKNAEYRAKLKQYRDIQDSNALQVYQKLQARNQLHYVNISAMDLSAFAAWSFQQENHNVEHLCDRWQSMSKLDKSKYIPNAPFDILADDQRWHDFAAHRSALLEIASSEDEERKQENESMDTSKSYNNSLLTELIQHEDSKKSTDTKIQRSLRQGKKYKHGHKVKSTNKSGTLTRYSTKQSNNATSEVDKAKKSFLFMRQCYVKYSRHLKKRQHLLTGS